MEKEKDFKNPQYYENRELSWLKFDNRVLNEARDKSIPLLERLKFVSITSSNLDEFYMVRVASLKDMVHANYKKKDIAGMTASEQLAAINEKTREMVDLQYNTYNRSLLPLLKKEQIHIIDAFEDHYFYDCVEVTPELLKQLPIEDDAVVNNSFLVHGYYNFKHILFGKVCENDNNTRYFIGVPGMYCNRERFMASMFGFCNFKKSHRSDYSNPYFGYWYQEI